MLRRDFMPSSHNAALEERECRFHRVCMHIAVSVFLRVVNGLVLFFRQLIQGPRIDRGFIGHNDFHILAHMTRDDLPNGCGRGILGSDKAKFAVPLANANYYCFLALWTPSPGFPAHIRFIYLNCAIERLGSYFQHRSADSVAQIPCRLIADSERALNLTGRYSFFG